MCLHKAVLEQLQCLQKADKAIFLFLFIPPFLRSFHPLPFPLRLPRHSIPWSTIIGRPMMVDNQSWISTCQPLDTPRSVMPPPIEENRFRKSVFLQYRFLAQLFNKHWHNSSKHCHSAFALGMTTNNAFDIALRNVGRVFTLFPDKELLCCSWATTTTYEVGCFERFADQYGHQAMLDIMPRYKAKFPMRAKALAEFMSSINAQ